MNARDARRGGRRTRRASSSSCPCSARPSSALLAAGAPVAAGVLALLVVVSRAADALRSVGGVMPTHRDRVEAMLAAGSARHAALLPLLPPEIRASLPVDAQGITEAIDLLGEAAGLSRAERRELVRPHGVNPAVIHARVFGGAPLAEETVMGSFVEGARVRAGALADLADLVGGPALSGEVRALLVEHPLPLADQGLEGAPALREAYAAQE